MVRTYIRTTDRCHWIEESLQKAIKAVKEGKINKTAAFRFDVPRATLCRNLIGSVSKQGLKCLGSNTVLGNHDWALVEHLHNLEKMGFGVTPREVREIAFDFCNENGVPNNFDNENKLAGEDWFSVFRKSHAYITLRKPPGLSLVRAKTMNRVAVKSYVQRLNSVLKITGVSRVYDCDESGLSMVLGTKLVVGKTGRRVSYEIHSSESFAPCEVTSEPQTNENINKSGKTAAHEDLDDRDDPDDPKTSQSHSENEEADTIGIAVRKSQPVAILHGPSTSGVNVRTQPQKSLQEQSNCGICEGDFFDDEEGDP
ncbi:hypothetical protein PR048_005180 [Dryococelus australis]|uniref:HTH psq-type domain-containing protein n=1 Tax=Dryococelus australis TaxID=614101 RepID=A0ABQ9I8J0_9NEOP|nr:hypothetical protein PR048_005180 [Dryococelus australis]